LVVFLAFLVPVLIARFRRVPVVVGEILAGFVVGPSVLGLVSGHEPALELLAEIGFAFLNRRRLDQRVVVKSSPR
jgi:Kef-type K+ transport system membrane component KefB